MKTTLLITIFLYLILPTVIFAQFGLDQEEINVELIPANPKPNEVVYANITSFSIDLNSSKIIWEINGVVKKVGIGEKQLIFNTGEMNSTTILNITITTQAGETVEKTVNIKPSLMDLMWQSEGHTPPFYKGKALYIHQNKITFIAIPHIAGSNGEIGTKNLVYKWKLNGSVVDTSSGYGKNTLTMTGSIISRPLEV